jgi:hypothetical protein
MTLLHGFLALPCVGWLIIALLLLIDRWNQPE